MLARVRAHLTFANIISLTALFIALGAGAYAAGLAPDSVKSKHIKDGQVKEGDLGDDAVTAAKLGDDAVGSPNVPADALQGGDIDESSLFNDNSLDGADVNEGSLAQVPSAVLGGIGRWQYGYPRGCEPPDGGAFIDCGGVTLDLPSSARVLMIGTARTTSAPGNGLCRLASSSGALGGSQVLIGEFDTATTTAITDPIGPGSKNFRLECAVGGATGPSFRDINLSAVALSPN